MRSDNEREFWGRFGARVEERQHLGLARREELTELLRWAADSQEDWGVDPCVRLQLFDLVWLIQQLVRTEIRWREVALPDSRHWTGYASWLLEAATRGPSQAALGEPHRWRAFDILAQRAVRGDSVARTLLISAAMPRADGRRRSRPSSSGFVRRSRRPHNHRRRPERRYTLSEPLDRNWAIDFVTELVVSGDTGACELLDSIVRDASDPLREYAFETLLAAMSERGAYRHRHIADVILETCLYVARTPHLPYRQAAIATLAEFAHIRDFPWVLDGLLDLAGNRVDPYRGIAIGALRLPAWNGEARTLGFLREIASDRNEDDVPRRCAILVLSEAAVYGHEVASRALSTISRESSELGELIRESLVRAEHRWVVQQEWRDITDQMLRSVRAAPRPPRDGYP